MSTKFLATALLSLAAVSALAQQSPEQHSLKQDAPDTGSGIKRKTIQSAPVSFDKPYAQLSEDERAIVRSWYEGMAAEDEPPFPLHGTRGLYQVVVNVQQRLALDGDLAIFVTVGSDGKAKSVSVLSSPDKDLTNIVAAALLRETYKPARCGGQACQMEFPLRVRLTRSL